MGGLTGFLIIAAVTAVFAGLNLRARRGIKRMTDTQLTSQWTIDPATGERGPAPPGHHHDHGGGLSGGGHHGGGFSGGGHHGGFSGGDGGGHHG